MQSLFPVLMIVLSALAACSYCVCGDYARCVYWLAAAVLTSSITFWVGG